MTQVIATHPLLKPGDKLDFELGCGAQHWDNTHVWVTWTPAPIRRHREKTSPRLPISEHLDQSEIMRGKLKKMAEEKRDEGSDF
jgi:hypothetical protein